MDELLSMSATEAVLKEYAVAVRNLYQDRLILHDRIATGDLLNSIETYVEYDGRAYEVKMKLAKYWRFVEMDTEPHWPPPGALLKWIEWKPVIPRPMKNGKLPTPEQLDFLIRRKIAVFGTKGIPDLTDSVEDMNREYRDRLIAALKADFTGLIRKIVRVE